QPPDVRDGPPADQEQTRPGTLPVDLGPGDPAEPAGPIDVRAVVEGPDEHARPARFDRGFTGTKVLQVDSIGYGVNMRHVAGLSEQVRLRFADQECPSDPGGRVLLETPEPLPFDTVQPGARTTAGPGVVQPFLAIDIHQVHDGWYRFDLLKTQVRDQARRGCQRDVVSAV